MFVHLAIHYPRPEHVDDVLASMHRVDKAAEGTPGLIQMGAWRDENSNRLVGLVHAGCGRASPRALRARKLPPN
jgi:heme-degrading monooxygenase HmoA